MRQNLYFKQTLSSHNEKYIFATYSFRTEKVLFFNKETKKYEAGTYKNCIPWNISDCLSRVVTEQWLQITYKEAMELVKSVTNKTEHITYYNNPWGKGFSNGIAFFSYNSHMDKTIRHYKNGKQEDAPDFNKEVINRFVDRKEWVIISKDETEKLLDPKERYFTHVDGFGSDIVFVKYDPKEPMCCKSYAVDGKFEYSFTLPYVENIVKEGIWKEITKEEAEAMLTMDISSEKDIIYYNRINDFIPKEQFFSYDPNTKETKIHNIVNKNGKIVTICYSYDICEHFVKEKIWKHITKDEAYALLKTGEIIYYTTNNPQGFMDDTKFLSHDVDTGVTKVHTLNNKEGNINNSHTFKKLEATVKFGYWRHITKEEAEALLNSIEKESQLYFIGYINNSIKYIVYDVSSKSSCYTDADGTSYISGYSLENLQEKVNRGEFKQISQKEAFDLLKAPVKVKDEDDNSGLLEDIYAIRCFLNGERKMTDKLTMEEAYTFRKAAGNFYNYLTKEYKLSKPVKE